MRHRKNSKRLSRQSAHRKAVLRNQVKSLISKEKIKTTLTLAKESRRLAEKLISLGKINTLAARRKAFEVLADRSLVKLLFTDIAPRFNNRSGGYTRIVHLGNRRGDNADLAILELTEQRVEEKKPKKQKKAKKTVPEKVEKKETQERKETKQEQATPDKQKETPEQKPAKVEERKGFLGGLRKFLKQDKTE